MRQTGETDRQVGPLPGVCVSLTRQEDASLAADQHPIMVLGGAAVLAGVRLVAVSPFGDAPDEQRPVPEQRGSGTRLHGDAVPPPGDGDGPLPLHLTVQHQGAVPHRDDVTGLLEEGQLGRGEDTCEDTPGETWAWSRVRGQRLYLRKPLRPG